MCKSREIKFYELCVKVINEMAEERGINNLDDYFVPTDFHKDNKATMFAYLENKYDEFKNDWKRRIFAQFVFHSQNETGSHLINIVNFSKNVDVIYRILNGFNVDEINYEVKELVNEFRPYMSWRKNDKNPDIVMKRWCGSIIESAKYIKKFNSREDLIYDLEYKVWNRNENFDLSKKVSRFKERVKIGFGPALMCDLLKELGSEFSDVLKPDIHIKDIMETITGNCCRNDNKCYKEFIKMLDEINKEYNVSAYKLDKIIWLICSGKFYLNEKFNKNIFIKQIKEL